MESKKCKDCNQVKPLEEFYNSKGRSDGKMSYCKPCHKQRSYNWRENNLDLFNAQQLRSYYKKRDERITTMKNAIKSSELDYWVVYILPEEHYCGYTKNLVVRERAHRTGHKRITEGLEIVGKFATKKEALFFEAAFHALGWHGKNLSDKTFCLNSLSYE